MISSLIVGWIDGRCTRPPSLGPRSWRASLSCLRLTVCASSLLDRACIQSISSPVHLQLGKGRSCMCKVGDSLTQHSLHMSSYKGLGRMYSNLWEASSFTACNLASAPIVSGATSVISACQHTTMVQEQVLIIVAR
jgi:hypothetical protein